MGNETDLPTSLQTPSSPPNGAGNNAPAGQPTSVDFGELTDFAESGEAYGPDSTPETPPASPPSGAEGQPPAGVETPPAAPTAAPSAPSPSAAAAAPQPPAGQVPPTPPEPVAPQQQPAPAQAPSPQAAAAPPATQEMTSDQHRQKYLPALEQTYQLAEADVEEFRTAPEKALPKLAARLHYEVLMAARTGLETVLPQMIHGAMEQTRVHTENRNKFFETWPALKKAVEANPQTEATITSAIQAVRQVNPNLGIADIIKQAGMMACYTLGVQPDAVPAQAVQQPVQQAPAAAPQAPGQPTMQSAPPRPPGVAGVAHVPAGPAGGQPEGQSLWADIVADHESGNY